MTKVGLIVVLRWKSRIDSHSFPRLKFNHGEHQMTKMFNILLTVQVYNLFRQLGLRHLLVVPRPSRVVGMITRKDLILEVCLLDLLFSFVFEVAIF